MIKQGIFSAATPYSVFVNKNTYFPMHVHYETEIVLCISGVVIANVDGVRYEISEGEAVCIGCMARHFYEESSVETYQMVIEFGPLFIGDEYKYLEEEPFVVRVYRNTPENRDLLRCLYAIKDAYDTSSKTSSLTVKGRLFDLFALIIKGAPGLQTNVTDTKDREHAVRINNALTLIRQKYFEQLTVEEAAEACDYGVSVFCNSFKRAVGMGFHKYLNLYRIETAKYMLSGTEMNIEEIGRAVGFFDSKSFCRAFKRETNTTPGEYRRTHFYGVKK